MHRFNTDNEEKPNGHRGKQLIPLYKYPVVQEVQFTSAQSMFALETLKLIELRLAYYSRILIGFLMNYNNIFTFRINNINFVGFVSYTL